MTHTEFFNEAVGRAQKVMTHDVKIEFMLEAIAESLAAIADSLESMEGSLESISDNMWAEGSDL